MEDFQDRGFFIAANPALRPDQYAHFESAKGEAF
jgi:hypothetical protein